MKFLQATEKDLENTLNFYNELIDELDKGINYPDWTRDVYPNMEYLKEVQSKGELYLLQDDETIIGSTVLNSNSIPDYDSVDWSIELPKDQVLLLHTFGIKQDLRNTGIGSKFLEIIEDFARDNNYKAIRMDTIYGNSPAIKFYQKNGYTNLGQYELHYDETPETRFFMFEKNL